MKNIKRTAIVLSVFSVLAFAACGREAENEIRLTVWVSEADQAFAKEVA